MTAAGGHVGSGETSMNNDSGVIIENVSGIGMYASNIASKA